jgi:catechol 2,3-dioxygenase-like lactoylglutathione lyase family enzyme
MFRHAKQVVFVGVSDLDDAERFYGGVLGLDLLDARPFAGSSNLTGQPRAPRR